MEPIGSTYGSSSSSASYGSSPLRPDPAQRTPQSLAGSEVLPASEQKTQDDQQRGIQVSRDSGRQEFQPYGPESKPRSEPSKDSPPQSQPKDTSSVLPEDKKTEDPLVQQAVAQLKSIEEKVKAHEAAHKSAGGAMTGPVSYSYTRGPDGKNYITGGEVPISASTGRTPQETISKMQQVIRADLAPSDPSSQDRAVAGQAAQMLQQAQQLRNSSEASATSGTSGTTTESPESKDAVTAAENATGSTSTDTSVDGGRRPKPEAVENGIMTRASKAYSDPSVTGEKDPSRNVMGPGPPQAASEPLSTGSLSQDRRKTASDPSPSMITGFGPPQLSYYA